MLVGGDPGIGKSTLTTFKVLQGTFTKKGAITYVSGEESLHQIKMRADRLGDLRIHWSFYVRQVLI